MNHTPEPLESLLHAVLREIVLQCLDLERLAWLEHELIDAMCAAIGQPDRKRIRELVQEHIDRTCQALLFDYDRIRNEDCPSCAALGAV